jgi:hypothetical protein
MQTCKKEPNIYDVPLEKFSQIASVIPDRYINAIWIEFTFSSEKYIAVHVFGHRRESYILLTSENRDEELFCAVSEKIRPKYWFKKHEITNRGNDISEVITVKRLSQKIILEMIQSLYQQQFNEVCISKIYYSALLPPEFCDLL